MAKVVFRWSLMASGLYPGARWYWLAIILICFSDCVLVKAVPRLFPGIYNGPPCWSILRDLALSYSLITYKSLMVFRFEILF